MDKNKVYLSFFNSRSRAVKNFVYLQSNLAEFGFLLVLVKNSEALVNSDAFTPVWISSIYRQFINLSHWLKKLAANTT